MKESQSVKALKG